MTYDIALIICWYGELPWYFRLFVQSVKFNPSIDILFVTDIPIEIEIPNNFKIINITLDEFNQRASSKLGFPVSVKNPYKLCDFKPSYGFLFADLLDKYQFWAHGDCDIIFGDIRSFITPALLNQYDLISVRHDFLTGYFTLYKNNDKLNTLFYKSKDFRIIFQSDKHYCFDETNFEFESFSSGIRYSNIESEVESMTHVVMKASEENYIKAHFDFLVVEGNEGKLQWNKGKLVYKRKFEILLYHLIKFKIACLDKTLPPVLPTSYRIGKSELFF